MLIDRPEVVEGSSIQNATVPNGASFPASPNIGEMFFITGVGLHVYGVGGWEVSATGAQLTAHITDDTRHLTSAQNTLIDGITATSADINSIPALTSRVTTDENNLATHIADNTKHLTAAQNTLVDGITVSSADINSIPAVTGRVTTVENTLSTHMADDTRHLTAAQNTLVDGITVSSADINSIPAVTGRVTTVENTLSTHMADMTKHLTPDQNTFLDGLNLPTLTSAQVNFLTGTTANIQGQLNAIVSVNSTQTTDIQNLQTNQTAGQDSLQSQLNTHMADDSRHLTAAQNTFLDGITVDFAQVNALSGLTSYLSGSGNATLANQLSSLDNFKLNISGSNSMTGSLNMGGQKIINVASPTLASDAANKDYVDSFVQGLHWVGSSRVATVENTVLSGLQTIDGIVLASGDRVLVKNQSSAAQNGIWIAASGAWSRANDFNTTTEINNSAVFVLEGTTLGKSTWIQLSTIATLNTDPITWSAFSGPIINTAGPGISLAAGGMVSILQGYGLTFDGSSLVTDLMPGGGLMHTQDNATASVASGAQLALTNVGTAGTYKSVTTDAKGRVTGGTNPTTLAGYGITDAANIAGANFTGIISAPQIFAGALTGYTGFASNLVVNYAGNNSVYGILLKPASTTSTTNAITFLSSTSTTAAAGPVGAIAQLAGDIGMNLTGTWYLNGQPITTSTNAVQKSGDTMTGPLTLTAAATAVINLNTTTDNSQAIVTMSQSGLTRWRMGKLATPETGSNVGSDFNIGRYTDAGSFIDSPITIARNTGLTTITAGGLRIATTGGAAWATIGSVSTASSFMGFLRGGTSTAAGYIGTDGGGILSGGVGDKFGIRSETDLIFLSGAGLAATITSGGRMLIGQTADDGVNRLQVNGSISATNFVGPGTGLTGTAAGLSIGGNAATVQILTDDTYAGIEYVTLNRGGGGSGSVQYNTNKLSFVPSTGNLRAQNGFYTDLSVAYGKNLYVGNTPSSGANQASVAVTNGNLHIDPTSGNYATYLSFYSGTGGTKFGNGASGIVADVSSTGVFTGNGSGLSNVAAATLNGFITSSVANPVAADTVAMNSIGYVQGVSLLGQTDGALHTQAYNASYQHQIFGDYRTGSMMVRGKNNNVWQPWYQVWDSRSLPMSVAASGNSGVLRDPNGYIFGSYINMTDDGNPGSGAAVTSIITKRGDNYYRSSNAANVKTFLGITGQDVYSVRTNTDSFVGVARELAWKNYGNSHTIFDASAGTSPSGSGVNNTNAANPWTTTFPTLMGWNGSSTYGVRVDSARTADGISDFTIGPRSSADVNSYRTSGHYSLESTPANATNPYGSVIVASNSDVGLQIAGGYSSDSLYFRGWYSSGATFTPWRTVVHSGNIGSQTVAAANKLNGPAYTNGTDGWFRSQGTTGWYNETYAVGIYATEAGMVRTYNSAGFTAANLNSTNHITFGTSLVGQNYGSGLVGQYESTKIQAVFSMGDAYRPAMDGSGTANHYGIAWTHSNAGGQSHPNLGHQMMVMEAGIRKVAIGTGIWNGYAYRGAVSGSSYGSITVAGATGGYSGIYLPDAGGTVSGMFDGSGNGGDYDPFTGWHLYWNRSTACLGLGGSSTAAGYRAYTNGSHYVAGNLEASGDVTAFSDARFKTNVKTIENAGEKVAALRGITFERIVDGTVGTGVIAQDVMAVLPEAVHTNEDGYMSVAYGNLVGLLIESVKELQAEVRDLKAQINRPRHESS